MDRPTFAEEVSSWARALRFNNGPTQPAAAPANANSPAHTQQVRPLFEEDLIFGLKRSTPHHYST